MKYGTIIRSFIACAILVLGFTVIPGDATSAKTGSVAGEWNAEFITPGGVSEFKLVFEVVGEKLTGTVKRERGDSALKGTIKGDDIKFSYDINYNGRSLTLKYEGKVDGDNMKGEVFFGESGRSTDWSAKRAKKK